VTIKRCSPVLMRSGARLGHYFRRRPATKMLVGTIPEIQKKAVKMLTNHARKGGTVTPAKAAKAMAVATAKTLATPRAATKSLANNAVKTRRAAAVGRPPRLGGSVARAER
jgi:hypothetical protein